MEKLAETSLNFAKKQKVQYNCLAISGLVKKMPSPHPQLCCHGNCNMVCEQQLIGD